MSDESSKAVKVSNTLLGRSVVPFTSGLFAIYAFFWPESFGHWFGTIIHEIRIAAGF
jgi:hypothetical protein